MKNKFHRAAFLFIMLVIMAVSISLTYAAVDKADCVCEPDPMMTRTPALVLETPSVEEWLEWVE